LVAVRIVKYPHPTLRHKSKPLRRVDGELRSIVAQMFDIMYSNRGIGLAANQVDLPYRLFVINVTGDSAQADQEHVFINPEITLRSGGMAEDEEGCLSFPELYAQVKRPERCTVVAYNLAGQEVKYELKGLFARAVQHEFDHLDGVLFVDRLTPSGLLSVRESLADLERELEGDRSRGLLPDDDQIVARLAELESLRA
jgi:peptide deformylase